MYIQRLLEGSLKKALKTFPAVVVTGPRQAGKSTLVQKVGGGAVSVCFPRRNGYPIARYP